MYSKMSGGAVIYDSIPPLISGKKTGQLVVRIPKIDIDDGRVGVGYKAQFEWWGQKVEPAVLNIPWKAGQAIDEAIFPIRVDRGSLEGYLSDMETLIIYIYDPEGKLYGHAEIPLDRLINNSLCHSGPVVVRSSDATDMLGKIYVDIITVFGDLSSKRIKKLESKALSSVNTFQRMEALVVTDNSGRYTEWPKTSSGGGDFKPQERRMPLTEQEPASPVSKDKIKVGNGYPERDGIPLLARRAAARRRAGGGRHRQSGRGREYTGKVLPNLREEGDGESLMSGVTEQKKSDKRDDSPAPTPPLPAPDHPPSLVSNINSGSVVTSATASKTAVLVRAQHLLSKVKASLGSRDEPGAETKPQRGIENNMTALGDLPRSQGVRRTHSKVGEVDWLLRGVPEVWDEEVEVSDELVERLISEGGRPPAQLAFPSLYAASQRTLANLEGVRRLRLTFSGLHIYSARYGVRREGSYIVVQPPAGCTSPHGGERSSTVDLPEMGTEPSARSKNVLRGYAVGKVVLGICIEWGVCLTDGVLRDWLASDGVSGTVRVELYSYLSPPARKPRHRGNESEPESQGKTWTSPALLLAHADIPMGSLLSTAALSAMVTVDLVVDQASQATIADRLMRLPTGSHLRTAKPLGDTLGTLSCEMALLDENSRPLLADGCESDAVRDTTPTHNSSPIRASVRPSPASISTGANLSTNLDSALGYVPSEPSGPAEPVRIGVAVHHLDLCLDESTLDAMTVPINKEPVRVVIEYKIALSTGSIRDQVDTLVAAHRLSLPKHTVELSSGRVHTVHDIMNWRFIYFEVWLKWRGLLYPGNDESRLLGLVKFPVHTCVGECVSLPVVDPSTGQHRGHLYLTLQFHHMTEQDAENLLEKCLTTESVRRMLRSVEGSKVQEQCKRAFSVGTEEDVDTVASGKVPVQQNSEGNTLKTTGGFSKPVSSTSTPANSLDRPIAASSSQLEANPCEREINGDQDFPSVAPPKVSGEPDLSFSLSSNTKEVGGGSRSTVVATSMTGTLTLSADSLIGGLFSRLLDRESRTGSATNSLDSIDALRSGISGNPSAMNGAVATPPLCRSVSETSVEQLPSSSDVRGGTVAVGQGHILDMNVEDSFSRIVEELGGAVAGAMGCFVCYNFPGLADSVVDSWNSVRNVRGGKYDGQMCLWWDGDCSVLNSRNRHEFDVPPGRSALEVLGLTDGAGLDIFLVPSDSEGNMPVTPVCVGQTSLPAEALSTLLNRAGCSQGISLPLRDPRGQLLQSELKLLLSHRIVPVNARRSSAEPVSIQPISASDMSPTHPVDNLMVESAPVGSDERNSDDVVDKLDRPGLSVRVDRAVHLSDELLSRGVENVFVRCSLRYPSDDVVFTSAFEDTSKSFSTKVRGFGDSVVWDEEHVVHLPDRAIDSVGQPMRVFRRVCLVASLHSRQEWRFRQERASYIADGPQVGDVSIGSAVVDLALLASGCANVEGWYHVLDDNQRSVGQIKLSVAPNLFSTSPSIAPSIEDTEVPYVGNDHHLEEDSFVSGAGGTLSEMVASIMRELEASSSAVSSLHKYEPLGGMNESGESFEENSMTSGGSARSDSFMNDVVESPPGEILDGSMSVLMKEMYSPFGGCDISDEDDNDGNVGEDNEQYESGVFEQGTEDSKLFERKSNIVCDLGEPNSPLKVSLDSKYEINSVSGYESGARSRVSSLDGDADAASELESAGLLDDKSDVVFCSDVGSDDNSINSGSLNSCSKLEVLNDAYDITETGEKRLDEEVRESDGDEDSYNLEKHRTEDISHSIDISGEDNGQRKECLLSASATELLPEVSALSTSISDPCLFDSVCDMQPADSVLSTSEINSLPENFVLDSSALPEDSILSASVADQHPDVAVLSNSMSDFVDVEHNLEYGNSNSPSGGKGQLQLDAISVEDSASLHLTTDVAPESTMIETNVQEFEGKSDSRLSLCDVGVQIVPEESPGSPHVSEREKPSGTEPSGNNIREACSTPPLRIFEPSALNIHSCSSEIEERKGPEHSLPVKDPLCTLRCDAHGISELVKSVMMTNARSAPWAENPGRRKKFVDAETERISRVMLGSVRVYSRLDNLAPENKSL